MLRAHYGLAEDSGPCYSHLDPRLRVISGNWPVSVAQETKSMVNRLVDHITPRLPSITFHLLR